MAIYLTLDEGACGALTRYLQVLLCAHGNPFILADGRFGHNTKAAVAGFQNTYPLYPHQLPSHGVVDAQTWAALQQFISPRSALTQSLPIQEGFSGTIVYQLQTLLRSHYSNVLVNGYFDTKIAELVKHFQSKWGLPSTGIVDSSTWTLLCQKILHLGDRGERVKELQIWLRKHGYILITTCIFDEATLIAVMDFQQRYGLPVDGLVGLMTGVILSEAVPSTPQFVHLTDLCLSYTQLQVNPRSQNIKTFSTPKLHSNP
jgi:peptidoglycan hydrolase-like protein with peptidoglycan-binding domain